MPCPRGYESHANLRTWLEGQTSAVEACMRSLPPEEQFIFKTASLAIARSMASPDASGCITTRSAKQVRAYVAILTRLCMYPQTRAELEGCRRELEQLEQEFDALGEDCELDAQAQGGFIDNLQQQVELRDEEIQRLVARGAPAVAAPAPPAAPQQGVSWGVAIGAAVATGMVGYVVARFMR